MIEVGRENPTNANQMDTFHYVVEQPRKRCILLNKKDVCIQDRVSNQEMKHEAGRESKNDRY